MSEHVVVTGGAGFIGANVTRALLARGSRVTVLDDLSEGEAENLAELEGHPDYSFVHADVRDESTVLAALAGAEKVVHLAARKIPRYGNALATLDVNALGSRVVLEAAARHGAKIVVASTSDVYGKNPDVPFAESSSPSVIGSPKVRRWAYAVSKMYEEQVAFALHEERQLRVSVLRYFGGYGPYQHKGWLGGPQSVFFELAHRGEPLTIHGDGTQRRTFTHVEDMVCGTLLALDSERAVGELYNIGATRELSINELAQLCWRIARDDEPRIVYQSYASLGGNYEDVQRRVPDPSLAREHLGFEAQVDVEDGLRRTWDWLRETRLR